MDDLVELDMVDFDVILCMDWLHFFYAPIDCRTGLVKFHIRNDPVIEWSRSSIVSKGHFILYLKARKLVSKVCIYSLVRVNHSSAKVPPIESVPIVKVFLKLFSNDLPESLLREKQTSARYHSTHLSNL